MKKVLCDKDGKFISIHDGDCLTHEDGTILIYRECEREDTKVAYHAILRYGEKLHTYKNGYPFTHYDLIPAYRFSTLIISRPRKKRKRNCLRLRRLSMIRKECYMGRAYCRIPGNDVAESPTGQIRNHFSVFPGLSTRIY